MRETEKRSRVRGKLERRRTRKRKKDKKKKEKHVDETPGTHTVGRHARPWRRRSVMTEAARIRRSRRKPEHTGTGRGQDPFISMLGYPSHFSHMEYK